MSIRMEKPWIELTSEAVKALPGQLGARPIWASDMPKWAAVLATTRSQCSASSLPPAIASPCTMATTGSG